MFTKITYSIENLQFDVKSKNNKFYKITIVKRTKKFFSEDVEKQDMIIYYDMGTIREYPTCRDFQEIYGNMLGLELVNNIQYEILKQETDGIMTRERERISKEYKLAKDNKS